MTQIIERVLGYASDPKFAEALHDIGHRGRVEYISIGSEEAARRRLRVSTDSGTDCAISLGRDQELSDGAVLYLGEDRAIVVRHRERQWLALVAANKDAAVRLGYFLGNLHWKVRFESGRVLVALEGPRQTYVDRLEEMLAEGGVSLAAGDHG